MPETFDHRTIPQAEFLQSIDFAEGHVVRLHRYGGQHSMHGPCHCHPLILTTDEIYGLSTAELQKRLDNFYRRQ